MPKKESDHDEHVVRTQEGLELHVLLGHMTSEDADSMAAGEALSTPDPVVAVPVEADPCQGGPRLKDLPSTMAMAALMNPVTLTDRELIDFPSAEAPCDSVATSPLTMVSSPESPPPQN